MILETPTIKTITKTQLIVITSLLFGALILSMAFNFAQDNQLRLETFDALTQFRESFVDEDKGFNDDGKEFLTLWLATLDDDAYISIKENDNQLPLCANHVIANKGELIEYGFNKAEFWFNFPNGTQVSFSNTGSVRCYLPTDNSNLKILADSCSDICPGGIDELQGTGAT